MNHSRWESPEASPTHGRSLLAGDPQTRRDATLAGFRDLQPAVASKPAPTTGGCASSKRPRPTLIVPARQRGAVLFISLMILILLTLLALSASQVTSLQERMAGIYRADNAAFQAAEQRLREQEQSVLQNLEANPSGCVDPVLGTIDAAWLAGTAAGTDHRLESLCGGDPASTGSLPLCQGTAATDKYFDVGGPNCLMFRLTTYEADNAADPSSRAIVQSVYVP